MEDMTVDTQIGFQEMLVMKYAEMD